MKKTLLAVMVAAFGLSACSSLDGKSPSEMVKITTERSLTKDYSYNFNGEARAFLSDKDKGVAPAISAEIEAKQASEAGKSVDTMQKEADAAIVGADEKKQISAKENKNKAEDNEYADEINIGANIVNGIQKYPAAAVYLNDSRLFFNGAVDLRAKKIEIVPELQIKARNEFSSIKMPILLDGNDMSVSVDTPATIPMVLNFFIQDPTMRARLVNQSIRFNWADMEDKTIPVKSALKAVVKSAYAAYNSIPADQFRLDEMDEFGKRVGARYRISVVFTKENEEAYYQAFVKEFNEELTRLEIAGRDEGSTREGYDKVRQFFESLSDSMLSVPATDSWLGSPLIESIYLDRKGRTVGKRNYVQINGTEKAFNIDMSMAMSRFGRPVFTYQPKASESISFKELIEAYKKSESESGETLDETEVSEDAAAEVIEAPAVKKQAVKKKKANSKQKRR